MNVMIMLVLIGLAVGLLASILRREGRFGVLGDISVGVLGALIGGYLYRFARVGYEDLRGSLAAAVLGSAFFVIDLRLLRRSLAEQVVRSVICPGFNHSSKPLPLLPRPAETDSGICPVCGQKHLH